MTPNLDGRSISRSFGELQPCHLDMLFQHDANVPNMVVAARVAYGLRRSR